MPARVPTSIPGIYAITHIASGRSYVGQALNIRKRWELHRHYLRDGKHHNFILQQVWDKYGAAAFRFSILKGMSDTPKDQLRDALNLAEVKAINAEKWPFNLMDGGVTAPTASAQTRQLLSKIQREKWLNEERRKSVSQKIKALHANPEWKDARAAAISAALRTPEARAATSKRITELWQSDAHRHEQSERRKANWQDEEYRETQTKSRAATWADPEVRERRMKGLRASWTPEMYARRAATMRATYAKKATAKQS